MLSKACVVGVYQRKLEEMAADPELALIVAVPPFWKGKAGTVPLERAHTEGYRLTVLPPVLNGAFHLHFYPTFGRLLREVKPDLVHIDEEPYNLATFMANRSARGYGAKTLWFSWQNLIRNYPWPFSWFERYNLQNVEYALVGSRTAAGVWREKGYRGPLAVIPQFGVDPTLFSPPDTPRDRERVHFAYAGRLVPEKGLDLLLDALDGVPGDWRLTILGEGPAQEALQARVDRMPWKERVTFRASIPSVAMPDFYRGIDVLVLPSRSSPNWTEQFGRVLIEAMASGAAVVGSDSGEIPHVVGDAGVIFPEEDVGALRAALTRFLREPTLRDELGERGRERVLERFTQRHVARETVNVYREVLS